MHLPQIEQWCARSGFGAPSHLAQVRIGSPGSRAATRSKYCAGGGFSSTDELVKIVRMYDQRIIATTPVNNAHSRYTPGRKECGLWRPQRMTNTYQSTPIRPTTR